MLRISFNDDTEKRLVAKLQEKGPLIIQVLATKLNKLMLQLMRYVVTQKLEGQVLHRRSGTLADSIRALPVELLDTKIVGVVEGGGGTAFYGKIHELGGVFKVKERARKFATSGPGFMAHHIFRSGTITFPPRPFMAPSLTENAAMIEEELRAVLNEELAK